METEKITPEKHRVFVDKIEVFEKTEKYVYPNPYPLYLPTLC